MAQTTAVRPLHLIADEILADPAYRSVAWCADPYVTALRAMRTTADSVGADDGRSVLAYAISNLRQWRGETAKRIKAELRAHTKGVVIAD